MKRTILVLALIATLTSCQNIMARHYGGTETIDLPVGEKLVNVTWEGQDLWYLTRPMGNNDSAVTYQLHEQSNYGVLQGTITLKETKFQY